jgi:hypothetical protein
MGANMTDMQQTNNQNPQPQPMLAPMAIGSLNTLVIDVPGITFLYQIDVDATMAKNDELILQHLESNWEYRIKVADLTEFEDNWVELFYPNAPENGTFSLIQDPKDDDDPYYVFEELSYDSLGNVVPETQTPDTIPDEQEDDLP